MQEGNRTTGLLSFGPEGSCAILRGGDQQEGANAATPGRVGTTTESPSTCDEIRRLGIEKRRERGRKGCSAKKRAIPHKKATRQYIFLQARGLPDLRCGRGEGKFIEAEGRKKGESSTVTAGNAAPAGEEERRIHHGRKK